MKDGDGEAAGGDGQLGLGSEEGGRAGKGAGAQNWGRDAARGKEQAAAALSPARRLHPSSQ